MWDFSLVVCKLFFRNIHFLKILGISCLATASMVACTNATRCASGVAIFWPAGAGTTHKFFMSTFVSVIRPKSLCMFSLNLEVVVNDTANFLNLVDFRFCFKIFIETIKFIILWKSVKIHIVRIFLIFAKLDLLIILEQILGAQVFFSPSSVECWSVCRLSFQISRSSIFPGQSGSSSFSLPWVIVMFAALSFIVNTDLLRYQLPMWWPSTNLFFEIFFFLHTQWLQVVHPVVPNE